MARRLTIVLVAIVTSVLSTNASAVVGRTPGQFAVSPTGSAQYSIPIWVPPGPKGIQPSLSLTYDSHAGKGPQGIGWFISGLGSIARCNKTWAQDPAPAAVTLATSDGYCLNGNRLRLTGGTYGSAGSTYQTEIADFSNITAYGAAGNGPAYFTVQDRDGLTYQYGYTDANGNGVNSQVIAAPTSTATAWLLSKVIDRAGNNYVVNYSKQTGTSVPSNILWTPASLGSSSYQYNLTFVYAPNGNVPQSSLSKYVAATAVQDNQLLSQIAISYQGTTVKDYFLAYQASPTTGRYELNSVTECADLAESNCFAPTSIGYQDGTPGVSTSPTAGISSVGSTIYTRHDLNGDGIPDVVFYSNGHWYVCFGSTSGYGAAIDTGITVAAPGFLLGNVNAGSEDGILVNNAGTWWYYTWNGSSFTGTTTRVNYNTAASQFQLADVNGDGLPDLVSLSKQLNGGLYTVTILAYLNTSNGSTPSFNSSWSSSYVTANVTDAVLLHPDSYNTNISRFDFDGDGRDDLMLRTLTGSGQNTFFNYYELMSAGVMFNPSLVEAASISSAAQVAFGNWNDDACTDVVAGGKLYLSDCTGGAAASYSVGLVLGSIDWDGDGRSDLVVQNGTTLGVYLSTGSGVSTLIPTSIPYSASCNYLPLDVGGNGLDALGCVNGSLTYYSHNGPKPDLATKFTDGYGNWTSPNYLPLSQTGYFSVAEVYPEQNYNGPLNVVNSFTASDGVGGTYTTTYYYGSAVVNVQGRGFEGFGVIGPTDSRTGIFEYKNFNTTFPYTGMVIDDHFVQPTYKGFGEIINQLATLTLDSTAHNQRYFPYVSSSTINSDEVGGPLDGQLTSTATTTYETPDSYGNFASISTVTTDKDSGSPYYGDTWTTTTANTIAPNPSTWCLTLPTQTTVTNSSTAPGVAAVTRTVAYNNPDYTMCRQTEKVIEPNSATYKVTEDYVFDSFGNLWKDTLTGVGMLPRLTTTTWGTTGQFPTTIRNPLGQSITLGYDPNSGMLISQTDPNYTSANPLRTTWMYDLFGRKTQETRPDGTYTTWTYNDCASWGGCLFGSHALALAHYIYNVGGSIQNDGTTYFDTVDRPVMANVMNLSGGYNRNEVRYDNLGRVAQQAMPCIYSAVASSCPYWTTNYYDALNRMTKSQRPISATNSTFQTTTIQYAGRTTTVTDPQGKNTTKISLVTGSLARTRDHNGYFINVRYDAFGSPLSVTDSLSNTLNTMTYDYGLEAFQRSSNDADMGPRSSTYDALGELTAYTDAKGQNFSVLYDSLSRPTTRTEPDLTTTWTWGSSAASHNIGRLASVSSAATAGTYSESYSFDNFGRPSSETIALPVGGSFRFDYAYDTSTGLLQSAFYPYGYPSTYRVEVAYAYQHGILSQLSNAGKPTTIWWQANGVNPRGQITQETTGDASGMPRMISNRTYDAVTGWLGSIQTGVNGGAALQNESYLHDLVGNLTQRQDNNAGLSENIYYDNLYRLDHSVLGSTTNLQMCYDNTGGGCSPNLPGMGNITSRSDIAGGAAWTYDPTHKHQVRQAGSSSFTYTYDANGNASTRNGTTLGWTSYNYPSYVATSAESASFDYGPNHQRWRMQYSGPSGPETTYYATPLFEKVVTSSGTEYRYYLYAGNRPVVLIGRATSGLVYVRSLLTDQQGSISSMVTDATGASYVKESFTAFGNRRDAGTWTRGITSSDQTKMDGATRAGYTFQTVLGSMGLNHMNGRVEDSVTGRFLSADPYVSAPDNTQGWNRYSYVNNNPLSLTDATGFQADQAGTEGNGNDESTVTYEPQDPYPSPSDTGCTFSCSSSAPLFDGPVVQCTVCCGSASLCWAPPTTVIFESNSSVDSSFFKLAPTSTAQSQGPALGKAQSKKSSFVQSACSFAGTDSPDSSVAEIANAVSIYDDTGRAFGAASRSLVALGNNVSRFAGPLGTVLSSGQTAYQLYNGQYLDATFSAVDFGLALALSTAGPLGIAADVGLNAAGGSKAAAKGVASGICMIGGGT